MAELYVNEMAKTLKDFHIKLFPGHYNYLSIDGTEDLDLFYEALAWQGLKGHDVSAYLELPDSKKKAMDEILILNFESATKTPPCN